MECYVKQCDADIFILYSYRKPVLSMALFVDKSSGATT